MIRSYTFEEFMEKVRAFHGFNAPGLAIGGFMVDLAYRHLPKEGLFDALCETPKCLPDAIQLLTPCTVGNSWLTVINLGRYALKREQDDELLLSEIREAGTAICKVQRVLVVPRIAKKQHRTGFAICPQCKESYPFADGPVCLGCQHESLYVIESER